MLRIMNNLCLFQCLWEWDRPETLEWSSLWTCHEAPSGSTGHRPWDLGRLPAGSWLSEHFCFHKEHFDCVNQWMENTCHQYISSSQPYSNVTSQMKNQKDLRWFSAFYEGSASWTYAMVSVWYNVTSLKRLGLVLKKTCPGEEGTYSLEVSRCLPCCSPKEVNIKSWYCYGFELGMSSEQHWGVSPILITFGEIDNIECGGYEGEESLLSL